LFQQIGDPLSWERSRKLRLNTTSNHGEIMARATAQNKTKTPSRIGDLSFVRKNRSDGQLGRHFWSIEATGDYDGDCQLGERLALEYLAFEEADRGAGGGHLQHIVGDMPRPLTGVEISFLMMVSFAAGAGAHEARRISAFWQSAQGKIGAATAAAAP
jgi:hypothetical protein